MENDKQTMEFVALLERNKSILRRICVLFSDRSAEGIRDIYQDIVCELWLGYPRFRHESGEKTWIYHVALNVALQRRRHLWRAPVTIKLDDRLFDTWSDEADDEMVERLYLLVERLPDEERALAYLYVDNLSMTQIAMALGISPSTARQRVKRMKDKLKKLNEDEER